MNIINAIILGIVEGLTEFLPISSTGHLVITSSLLNIANSEFVKSFNIAIQLGAILSVIVLYWESIIIDCSVFKKIMIAFIPTAIIGFIFYPIVKNVFLGNPYVVVGALFIGGWLIILIERYYSLKKVGANMNISYKQAFLIGLIQAFAIIPGVSRSGATILGGMLVGLDRKSAVEFSFLLAIPTMIAAVSYDLMKTFTVINSDQFLLLAIGFITSFLVALLSIKCLLAFIKRNDFVWFGFYRMIVAVVFWWLIYSGIRINL